jgi:hypothetical protein
MVDRVQAQTQDLTLQTTGIELRMEALVRRFDTVGSQAVHTASASPVRLASRPSDRLPNGGPHHHRLDPRTRSSTSIAEPSSPSSYRYRTLAAATSPMVSNSAHEHRQRTESPAPQSETSRPEVEAETVDVADDSPRLKHTPKPRTSRLERTNGGAKSRMRAT